MTPRTMTDIPASLLDGYRRFRRERYERDHTLYRSLADLGQAPRVMVIACCDSRAAPETVFDAGPGEIFVVRNVANRVPPCEPDGGCHGTAAALEFAVRGLKVGHILVMGHARCGGVRSVLNPAGEPLSPRDYVGGWMKALAPAAREIAARGGMAAAERQTALERASIRLSIANLRTYPFVSTLETGGRLGLHGAWFDISGGELWTMSPATGEFSRVE